LKAVKHAAGRPAPRADGKSARPAEAPQLVHFIDFFSKPAKRMIRLSRAGADDRAREPAPSLAEPRRKPNQRVQKRRRATTRHANSHAFFAEPLTRVNTTAFPCVLCVPTYKGVEQARVCYPAAA